MPVLDPKVTGKELPHRDYAADCSLTYDAIMVRACVAWRVRVSRCVGVTACTRGNKPPM